MACYEKGRRLFSRYFILFVHFHANGMWRAGFAITRKSGNAVQRNRIKRVLREFFRLNQNLMPPNTDIVVMPKRQTQAEDVHLACVTADLLPIVQNLTAMQKKYSTLSGTHA